jgi:hypothetical protein
MRVMAKRSNLLVICGLLCPRNARQDPEALRKLDLRKM